MSNRDKMDEVLNQLQREKRASAGAILDAIEGAGGGLLCYLCPTKKSGGTCVISNNKQEVTVGLSMLAAAVKEKFYPQADDFYERLERGSRKAAEHMEEFLNVVDPREM